MTEQLGFDFSAAAAVMPLQMPPRARRKDPVTSHAAAVAAPRLAADHQARILDALKRDGPAGKDALAARTGLTPVQVARRMHELAGAGLVKNLGPHAVSNAGRAESQWGAV